MVKVKKDKSVRLLPDGKPSPLDFETFFPWACVEFELPIIPIIHRSMQDAQPIKKEASPKTSKFKSKIMKESSLSRSSSGLGRNRVFSFAEKSDESPQTASTCPICAVFDKDDNLTEVRFNNMTVYRIMMQVLGICIPFQQELTKIVIRNSQIDIYTIHEISKFLPKSNITDISMGDSTMPELNFYQLLIVNETSNLRHLSLCRCNINDEAVKLIMERLTETSLASKSLMLLNLTSNQITDVGVEYMYDVLRVNRTLKYLNLADNKITNRGCFMIFSVLMEFKLSYDDIRKERHRRIEYSVTKNILYEKCLEKMNNRTSPISIDTATSRTSKKKRPRTSLTNLRNRKKHDIPAALSHPQSPDDIYHIKAEAMATEIMGPDTCHQFSRANTICRDGYICCMGNMALTYLNIAYNHIDYNIILQLFDLLYYQSLVENKSGGAGLVKVVIEGNHLPIECEVLSEIDDLLEKKVAVKSVAKKNVSKSTKNR